MDPRIVTSQEVAPRITLMPEAKPNVEALERALKARIKGEVRFDGGSRALYATDGSNYRQIPIGVVVPKDKADVIATIEICRKHHAPVVSRGGGTALAGQSCNVAVMIDHSKYLNQVLRVDPEKRLGTVQPGTILDDLRAAAEQHQLTFGPDPATHNHNTLGGMLGNDSCGVHSVMAGRSVDNVESMEVLLYDGTVMRVGPTSEEELERLIAQGGRVGEIYARLKALRDKYADLIRARYPKIPRRVSGYNLDFLLPENGFNVARALVGSEGTCVTILEATVNLVESPPHRVLCVLGYPSVYEAGDHIMDVLACGPIGLEGMDQQLITDMQEMKIETKYLFLLPKGKGWLIAEFGGDTPEEATAKATACIERLRGKPDAPDMKIYTNAQIQHAIWKIRESGLGATAWLPGQKIAWQGWEDAAVPPDKVGPYLRDFRKLLDRFGYTGSLYGHFGDGCIHTSTDFDLASREGIDKFMAFINEAADLVVFYGGSLSGEHGDGQARGALLEKMFGPELIEAFREFKRIWDPDWLMNPGKKVDPYRPDQNLRLGEHFEPWEPKTHFQFPNDHGSFGDAALRCAGVGECRRLEGGTMCPSFKVTREEKHSTRGRARLLFEMLRGESSIEQSWKNEAVKDALDLCLSCKGCKGDCPINVDMATYKAEFLSHYYEGRLRPITAYTMGLIMYWARLASLMPRVANFVTQTPGLSQVFKLLGGIAPSRQVPVFAEETFKAWFARRTPRNPDGPPVLLWSDTFTNHFHTAIAKAAVEVFETAGWNPIVPMQNVCCGRPLYDYGFLPHAKQLLTQTMNTLAPQIDDGIPMVVLEPSCCAVFRDELRELFPHDERARRLAMQTYTIAEFFEKFDPDFEFPALGLPAIEQGHCHQKAIMKMEADQKLWVRLGLEAHEAGAGCCGMAGSFGFEAKHYDLSQKVGEQKLLPDLRQADPNALILADGFSCREQIMQGSDRKPMHLAEVMRLALHTGGKLEAPGQPAPVGRAGRTARRRTVAALTIAAVGLLAWGLTTSRRA